MDREFSKDISSYKQKAAKGFSGVELAAGALTLAVGAAQIYFFTGLGIHMVIATYLAMPVTITLGILGFYKKNGYSLPGIIMKNRELARSSGAMPYRSEEEGKIVRLMEEQQKGELYGKKKKKR